MSTPDDDLEARLARAMDAAHTDSRLRMKPWANGPTRIARASRRRRLRHGSIAVTAVAALVLVTVGGSEWWLNRTLNSVQASNSDVVPGAPVVKGPGHLDTKPKTGQPFTMLILGTDSRTGTGTMYGTNADACHCSDTIILARINPQTSRVSLLSIPRDSRVTVTGKDRIAKLNSAYSLGPDNTVATIEQSLGIPINHWAVLDLAGFKGIIDAVGGIKLDFPYPIKDKNAGLDVETTGCQKVTGAEALAISRSRELKYLKDGKWAYDPTWENGRERREQIMTRVMAAHTVKASLSNPLTAKAVIDTFTSHDRLKIDNQVSGSELINLAAAFAGFDASTMQTFSLPTKTERIDGQDFEILQNESDTATIKAWYEAAQSAPKTTPTTSKPTPTTGATRSAGAPSASSGSSSSASTGSTKAPTAVLPNQPEPFDPVPCT